MVESFIQKLTLFLARDAAPNQIITEICKLQSVMGRALGKGMRVNLLTRDTAVAIFSDLADRNRIECRYGECEGYQSLRRTIA